MKRLISYMVTIFFLTSVPIQADTGLETPIKLPKTEDFFKKCLMLPMNMFISDEDTYYISIFITNVLVFAIHVVRTENNIV